LEEANYQGKTANPWADSVIERVAGYLTRCCADFGMLQPGRKKERRFIQFHMEPSITVFLAYDLHFKNIGDNAVISHPDWQLFGLLTEDVEDEVKRLALKDFWIIQSAAGAYRIAWKFKTWEDLINGISQ